jgi:hypothetical protein
MINLTYLCADGHDNQGYFKDRDSFLKQLRRGAIECLNCGQAATTEGLSRPQVNTGVSRASESNLRAESVYEYVGPHLYDEAMSMAEGERPFRPVAGFATQDQAEELSAVGYDLIPRSQTRKPPAYDA